MKIPRKTIGISGILIFERSKGVKYRNTLVAIIFLVCFGLPFGMSYTGVYGNGGHHDHEDHGNHDGDGDIHGNMSKTGIRGVVRSISGSTISVLNVDIDASTAEVKLMDCNTSLGIDDIAVSDIIEAKGTMSDGSFVASMIKLEGAGKLEGTVEAIGTNTVTLLGKVIDTTSAYCIKGELAVGQKARVYVRDSDTGLIAIAVKTKGGEMMEME